MGNIEGDREATTPDETNRQDSSVPVPEITTRPSIIKSREEALMAVKEEFASSRKNLLKGISEIAIELQEAKSEDEMVKALKKKKKNKSKKTVIKKRPSVRSVVSL